MRQVRSKWREQQHKIALAPASERRFGIVFWVIASSAPYKTFTSSMMAEMQVLKCQRPWKSSLTRLMV